MALITEGCETAIWGKRSHHLVSGARGWSLIVILLKTIREIRVIRGSNALFRLRGAEQILRRGAPELWLALHNERQMVECTSLLKDFGYAMWNLSGEAIDQINCLEVVARKRV